MKGEEYKYKYIFKVGHNIFILAHQLGRHNEELAWLLCPENGQDEQEKKALAFYRQHTAQIEAYTFMDGIRNIIIFRSFVPIEKWKGSFSQFTIFAHI